MLITNWCVAPTAAYLVYREICLSRRFFIFSLNILGKIINIIIVVLIISIIYENLANSYKKTIILTIHLKNF